MHPDASEVIREALPHRVIEVFEESIGLRAYIVLDSIALGPAAGGVRTRHYPSVKDAVQDACRLARAMTMKCALAGLDAGGGKAVVLAHPDMQREAAFEELGRRIETLGGQFRTAGDFGTTDDDLAAMARHTRYVHTDTSNLTQAVARGVVRCSNACADFRGRPGIAGLKAVVQGCGDIGAAVAEALVEAGAEVMVTDLVDTRARALAERIGATVIAAEGAETVDADIFAPCAIGGTVTPEVAENLKAWIVCGGANHITASRAADVIMHERDILFVPDLITSSGAVIEGIGRTVMGLSDRRMLVDALGNMARLLLEDAKKENTPPVDHAIRRAKSRLEKAND